MASSSEGPMDAATQKQQQQGGCLSPPSSSAVASSLNNSPYVQLGPIEVPKALQDGEKFIKWDEESGIGTPVTLRVDPKGFYLYWADQNNEIDLLDMALVRDVRTGAYAKKPRDMKLRQIVTMGSLDTLEQKTVTVCYGTDFVNVTFVNFCCTRKDIAQVWTDELMKLACNMIQQNGSTTFYLQKAHTKLCLQVDKSGKIPVKSIIKLFASSKDDRRRVEKALDVSGLPSGKGELLPLAKLQFEDFFNLYKNLTQRSEVEKIFDELVGASKRRLMSTTQVVDFLNRTQRDPRLNEILHPYANPARARDLINEYEPNKFNAQKGQLSLDGFLRYLMSDNNPVMAVTKLDICDDMDQPLAHYFINSSHNTYLTGHQLTGKSSVEIYRQSLLAGCRCVELDFWNGKLEEPIIVHGYTFVPEITARDVLEAIAESAFKTSDFPVILSFENHCNTKQQAKIANYCREIFGDMLLDKPLDSHPLEANVDLPPPSSLKRKIIIKNKKKHHHHHHHTKRAQQQQQQQQLAPVEEAAPGNNSTEAAAAPPLVGNGDIPSHAPPLQQIRQGSVESTGSSDTDSSSEDESLQTTQSAADSRDKAQQSKETEAGAEISALVNYVQPVHFSSFENAEKKMKCYEMSSFDEKQATTLLKERPLEFVNYNKHQLSRVYPAGTRFDSSNFMPQLFWNAGCQLVALNYQTMDLAMQLNQGIFEYNRRSGYLLKPEFMRRIDRRLDPFAESTVDGIIAGTVSITVLSGQFLSDKKIGTYVEVDMYGLPADTVRKRFRTRIVRENGVNPVYGEEPFVFKKVVLPELASVRITAYEESGKFIGHRVLPVIGLCPGYRHVNLRNELGQPMALATLFLCIVVKDYVPDGFSEFAEALANPIKYQSELEKRAEQLAVLTEDTEPIPEEGDSICEDAPAMTSAAGGRQGSTLPRGQQSVCDGFQENGGGAESSMTSAGVAGSVSDVGCSAPQQAVSGSANSSSISNIASTSAVASGASLVATGGGGGGGLSSSSTTLPTTSQQSATSAVVAGESSSTATTSAAAAASSTSGAKSSEAIEADAIAAESLESILANKAVREKRLEMEKKLESLRKKHDKEKLRICSSPKAGESSSEKKSKFNMGNKLVKRLSSKNIDPTLQVPPCPSELLDVVGEEGTEEENGSNITRSHSERLLTACREFVSSYREIQEKYHESIYNAAEKQLRSSQASQMKRLKVLLEKETSDVMRKLQVDRRNEVKALTQKHRDRDELVRMKREVASSLVERGVTERLRLAQAFEKRREDLQRQHDQVKAALQDHRSKAKSLIEKDESRSCIGAMDGFLVLFDSAVMRAADSSGSNLMSESQSASAICS